MSSKSESSLSSSTTAPKGYEPRQEDIDRIKAEIAALVDQGADPTNFLLAGVKHGSPQLPIRTEYFGQFGTTTELQADYEKEYLLNSIRRMEV